MPKTHDRPATMQAAVISRPGGPDVLELREVARPAPAPGEILVRIRATALNRADLLQRMGRYPAPPGWPQDIPGMEYAGEVVELGPGVQRWRVGDRVMGIAGGGTYAEYVAVHERAAAAVPAALSFVEGAAVPEAFITAHDALVTQAGVRMGERVLVHAAGSGVGLAAIQLARAGGARAFGTARTADKIDRAAAYGLAGGVVLGSDLSPLEHVVAGWGGAPNVVLDLVGGPYFAASIGVAAPQARIILIGTVAGREGAAPLGAILGKRLTIRGTVLRSRSPEEKIAANVAFEAQVVPLLADGTVRPVVDRVFTLAQAGEAHALMESNATFGKIVLEVA